MRFRRRGLLRRLAGSRRHDQQVDVPLTGGPVPLAPVSDAGDRVIVSSFDGGWTVRWENGNEIIACPGEERAWHHAKVEAQAKKAEALLYDDRGEVRLRADYRSDLSST